ncbi:DNA polymerase III subunit delta [Truepera radiovictrix]|uniref:DNA-directed DNA polymerase n=1 Tax=Truepera radiovictrix (strain DSM 17093 / CIP 108686 / LMG 22925 / RQ-24) TaxID=649638 RepID=D7CSS2_TRURR|nr:DNA polymerase III subunit delta [Truepera radiovictrix]ADI13689.1 DNA polymerase III, delta subunit [Truepera radiovictrix DSM 17093]WMT57747.1 DNA polymerase III subunit delta [Truepera radiovictrix]
MILAFSGDPFLATRAARRALRARGFRAEEVTELGEGLSADGVAQLAAQSGLFGQVALLLDFDAAFKGQAGVKPRNEVLKVLEGIPPDTVVVVLDLAATPARQKTYAALGHHEHLPTPRFNALTHWVRAELQGAGVHFDDEVPEMLTDLFGEDLPSIAAEIQKLAVLGERLSSERVREIVNRPASRDAFDLIEAVAKGEAARALSVIRSLVAQGEAPPRVLGALVWQYNLVARTVALKEGRARTDAGLVAQTLKVKPFVAQKALALAAPLDEARLGRLLSALLKADVAMKTGKDELWALESLALELSSLARVR